MVLVSTLEDGHQAPLFGELQAVFQFTVMEYLVSHKLDLADSNFGPFVDDEPDTDARGGDVFDLGVYRTQRLPVQIEQFLQCALGHPDFGGVILAVDSQSDLALLEVVQNIGFREGFCSRVFDGPDERLFLYDKGNNLARLAVPLLDGNCLKEVGFVKGSKVQLQACRVKCVPVMGLDVKANGVFRNAAVTPDFDVLYGVSLRRLGQCQRAQDQESHQMADPRF